jgi:arylsulfatase A-like enzyme
MSLNRQNVPRGVPLHRSRIALLAWAALAIAGLVAPAAHGAEPPSVLVLTVDTLRADRMSSYGYTRPTSPALDALMERGVRFTAARTTEPLTSPALCSLWTGLPPHEHGSSRNGLRMRPGLDSAAKRLSAAGWHTAAFVANWTLKDELSRLGEHFDDYNEVFTRKRWFGLIKGESTAEDLTDEALAWLDAAPREPWVLWLHYVEPHAPYVLQDDFVDRLGITGRATRSDRYDTEIAFVDQQIGRLLDRLREDTDAGRVMVVFTSDHGESLGEHGYWGHGRNLHEPGLHVPLGILWAGHLPPAVVEEPVWLTDLAPTILELTGQQVPAEFRGRSLVGAMRGEAAEVPPQCLQAHRGAVQVAHESDRARSKGLLEVGLFEGPRKEIYRLRGNQLELFDLAEDPRELRSLVEADGEPSERLRMCLRVIVQGLADADAELEVDELDAESIEQLKSLGYLE